MASQADFRLISALFTIAREQKPCVIFIDEIELLSNSIDSDAPRILKTEFLIQMQGAGTQNDYGIFVLSATNVPWKLDRALRRRFEKRIYVPLPDKNERSDLLKSMLKSTNHTIAEEEFIELSELTEG